MGAVNLPKEPNAQQLNEAIRAAFREIGQILAEARMEQNLTIKQVADQIHIRQRYLIDLEEGQLADLPGLVYVVGFIRTYARLLRLDGEELIRRIRELPTLPHYERNHIPTPAHSQEEPGFPALALSLVLVFVIAVGGYFFLKPATDSSPLPSVDNETMGHSSMALPGETPALGEKTAEIQQPEVTDAIPSSTPSNDPSFETSGQSTPQAEKAALAGGAVPRKKLTLKAKEPSWVEVRDEAGRVIFMKVLKSNEEYVLPEKPGITISTGNAGGLDVFLGEAKLPPLGGHGDVKRGIRLESLQ